MRQLSLAISPPPQPTLDNFVPGANAELLARLREFQAGNPTRRTRRVNWPGRRAVRE